MGGTHSRARSDSGAGSSGTGGRARGLGRGEPVVTAATGGVPAPLCRGHGVERNRHDTWTAGGERQDAPFPCTADGAGEVEGSPMNSNEKSHEPLVERALRNFGAANRQYAARPESFWELQAARIRAARPERAQRSRVAVALVPGLAVLLLVGFALVNRGPGTRPVAATVVAIQPDTSDHALLLEVERAVQSDTPLSLGPATLMVEESTDNLPVNSANIRKEPRSHEN